VAATRFRFAFGGESFQEYTIELVVMERRLGARLDEILSMAESHFQKKQRGTQQVVLVIERGNNSPSSPK
jgi:hypothetical protein